MNVPNLILASQSPRRAQLLQMLGLVFETMPADIDETWGSHEQPAPHAQRLAEEKARVISARRPGAVVIGSDTVVVLDGVVLGKPADTEDAVRMLLSLQGREHEVATGVSVCIDGRPASDVERVRVRFRAFDEATARAYVATGEPMDKAGAYGIQGYGATLVESVDGDYFAVMGLPICRLVGLLQESGVHYNFRGVEWIRNGDGA
jgi:septum formation protein